MQHARSLQLNTMEGKIWVFSVQYTILYYTIPYICHSLLHHKRIKTIKTTTPNTRITLYMFYYILCIYIFLFYISINRNPYPLDYFGTKTFSFKRIVFVHPALKRCTSLSYLYYSPILK